MMTTSVSLIVWLMVTCVVYTPTHAIAPPSSDWSSMVDAGMPFVQQIMSTLGITPHELNALKKGDFSVIPQSNFIGKIFAALNINDDQQQEFQKMIPMLPVLLEYVKKDGGAKSVLSMIANFFGYGEGSKLSQIIAKIDVEKFKKEFGEVRSVQSLELFLKSLSRDYLNDDADTHEWLRKVFIHIDQLATGSGELPSAINSALNEFIRSTKKSGVVIDKLGENPDVFKLLRDTIDTARNNPNAFIDSMQQFDKDVLSEIMDLFNLFLEDESFKNFLHDWMTVFAPPQVFETIQSRDEL